MMMTISYCYNHHCNTHTHTCITTNIIFVVTFIAINLIIVEEEGQYYTY